MNTNNSTSNVAWNGDSVSNVYVPTTATSTYTPAPMPPAQFPYASRFREIVTNMADLYARKNADYGNSFADTVDKLGYAAGLARIYDKWNRLCQLSKKDGKGEIKEESMMDTAIDGACYFIMLAMEIERLNPKPICMPTIIDCSLSAGSPDLAASNLSI